MATGTNPYRLTLRGVYILPTGAGLLQALGWVLLTAASLNFGLGVMLVFSLLLAAVGLVCMVETVRNLAGLEVELAPPRPLPAGDIAQFAASLRPLDGRARPALQLALVGADGPAGWRARLGLRALQHAVRCDVPAEGCQVSLTLHSASRGQLQAQRLVVASRWPLGLFRAWRSWQPGVAASIHPEALEATRPLPGVQAPVQLNPDWRAPPQQAGDGDAHGDFAGHRRRHPGDPLRRIDWRASLRTGSELVAQREVPLGGAPVWLRWSDHAPADAEIRLARLTAQVLKAARQGRAFALELPGLQLPLDQGPGQTDRALRMLAEFPEHGESQGAPVARGRAAMPVSESPGLPAPVLLRWTINVLCAALPLALQLPANAWLPWLALMAARLLLLRNGARAPGTLWLALGALAGAAWIHSRYHALLGREPGMALLLIMAGLKLLEVKRERDLHTLAVLSFFLLLSAHFQNQTPWLACWDLFCGTLIVDGLIAAQHGSAIAQRRAVLLRLIGFAVPLAILLFVLMPRPDRPFWGFSTGDEAQSGSLSDRMTPGSISHLRLSEQAAFRVRFQGNWPPPSRMYWRGPVLDRFDGTTWSVADLAPRPPPAAQRVGPSYDYSYQAEPGDSEWIFALELPEPLDRELRVDSAAVTRAPAGSGQARSWQLRSWPEARLQQGQVPELLALDLEVPEGNPQTRQLALPWRALAPAARIQAAQRAFLNARLQYSLDGPPLAPDLIDDLMFGSRTGYCEHFASAFTFMLRVAGVPARVVTGYQGGERNPLGDYLIVRQSDAHAWVEAWLADQGWIRIDPTALTVPALLTGGSQAAAPLPVPRWMPGFLKAGLPAWHRLQLLRDLATMHWERDVARLGAREQQSLLASLGLGEIPKAQLGAACALVVSAALGLQVLLAMRQAADGALRRTRPARSWGRPGRSGPADARQARLERGRRQWGRRWHAGVWLLQWLGLGRLPQEAPAAYLERLTQLDAPLAGAVRRWAWPCLTGIYGSDGQVESLGLPGRDPLALPALAWQLMRRRLSREHRG